MSARDSFKKLQSKYGLPPLNDLEKTFGFVLDEETVTPLNDVKKSIVDTFSTLQEVIEPILFVSEGSAPSSVFEAQVLHHKRDIYFELYKKNLELKWRSLEIFFDPKDEAVAAFIKECYDAWTKQFKPHIVSLTKMMKESWKNYEGEEPSKQSYLG